VLNPDVRHLLTDALRPPTGWRLDAAVATTYTLDINTLLLAPLSMAAYDQADQGIDNAATHELLEAIRRYADRTTIFCQAGGIHVPSTYRKLTVFAEDSIVEVAPPAGRVFHPKIWVLRFTNAADQFTHRLVCLSRNLTGDRSWDTVLSTEEDRSAASQMSADPAAGFLEDLLTMSVRPVPTAREILVSSIAESLRGRALAVPTPFTAGSLRPLGTARGEPWAMPATADRCLVISPFLDVSTVRRIPAGSTIVSRPDTFDRLGARALDGHNLLVLQPHAEAPPEEMEDEAEDEDQTDRPLEVKTGLHAKVLAWDTGSASILLTGSANATSAAFGGNVEFGVVLSGPASKCGAAAILKDTEKETGLLRLLQPYTPSADPTPDDAYELEREIEEFHIALAAKKPEYRVASLDDGYVARLAWEEVPVVLGQTWVRPITLKKEYDRALAADNVWQGLGHSDLTPFLSVRTRLERNGVTVEQSSAIRAELVGAPDDRARRVLRDLLSHVEDVLRYLALLLKDPGIDDVAGAILDATNDEPSGTPPWDNNGWYDDLVVLEPLVRAFARDDGSLTRVQRLLDDLRDDDGKLPDLGTDFEALWQIVSGAGRPT
jgi:hypothetical protein